MLFIFLLDTPCKPEAQLLKLHTFVWKTARDLPGHSSRWRVADRQSGQHLPTYFAG